jgi:hypothetical protein
VAVELIGILVFVVVVVYLVGEDRGHRRKDMAQHESDITAAENAVESAKTHLRNVKANPPRLPGWVVVLLLVGLFALVFSVSEVFRPHSPSYWRGD